MMKRPDGIILIIIYYVVTGVLSLIGVLFSVAFSRHDAGLFQQLCGLFRFMSLPFALVVLGASGLLYGILAVATGWGLFNYYAWARWIAIVLAALGMLNFPIGTVIGAAILWYLLQRKTAVLFQ